MFWISQNRLDRIFRYLFFTQNGQIKDLDDNPPQVFIPQENIADLFICSQ